MSFFKRLFQKNEDPGAVWCITYMDSNTFRRDRVMAILREAGLDVKPATNNLLVKQDQYDQAMNVLKSHGY